MTSSTTQDLGPLVDRETERMILGAALEYDGLAAAFVEAGIREAHFYSWHHRLIWRRLHQAVREELGPCLMVVRMLLMEHGELDTVGGMYLLQVTEGMPRPHHDGVRTLAQQLITYAVARDVTQHLQTALADLAARPSLIVDGFFSQLAQPLEAFKTQLRGRGIPDHLSHISEVMTEVRELLQAGPPEFIDTPWASLNHMLGGGFVAGEFVLWGARPGLGKTAAALEIARRTASRGHSVIVVSREMLKVALGVRMIAQEGPVDALALRRGRLTMGQSGTVDLAMARLNNLPIWMTHAPLAVDEIQRLVGILADEGPVGLVIVDYLQLVNAPADIRERRHQVEAVSKGLKAITLDHRVPVLCLSSLTRPAGDNKRPTLASLRESGNLEHDADTVVFFHRQDDTSPATECIVAKARNGRQGSVDLYLRGEYLRFEENLNPTHGD